VSGQVRGRQPSKVLLAEWIEVYETSILWEEGTQNVERMQSLSYEVARAVRLPHQQVSWQSHACESNLQEQTLIDERGMKRS
jgi:hypothetical protein